MRDIRDCSGPWKGTWVQGNLRGTMRNFRLDFDRNEITGGGNDRHGSFTMRGSYDPATEGVKITKRYWHTKVVYIGIWNGSFVSGHSIIGPAWVGERGIFEMWPEDEEEAIEFAREVESFERLEPVGV